MLAGSLAVALVLGAGLPAPVTLPQKPAAVVAVAAGLPASATLPRKPAAVVAVAAGLPASATLPRKPAVAVAVAAGVPALLQKAAGPRASPQKAAAAELYAVEYSLRDAAGSGAVIAAGELSVTPERPHAFEHRLPRGGEVEVVVEVTPRPDGTVVVELRLFEQLEGGEKIRWTPVVGVKRGGDATARVEWAGGGRTLALSLR